MLAFVKDRIQGLFNRLGYRLVRLGKAESARTRQELRRLSHHADFTITSTNILGKPLRLISNHSFVFLYEEIMLRQIYRFATDRLDPYIIDCGANIGLSTIYFKRLYPNARIVSFEPDPHTFETLSVNIKSHAHDGVCLNNKGVWCENGTVSFQHDPQSTASRIIAGSPSNDLTIEVVRLRDYLNERVDFLKIDIEGAESTVIPDIADRLQNVQNVFIEYHAKIGFDDSLHKILTILHDTGFCTLIENGCPLPASPLIERQQHKGFHLLVNIYGYRDCIANRNGTEALIGK